MIQWATQTKLNLRLDIKSGSIINVGVTSRRNEKHKRKPTE